MKKTLLKIILGICVIGLLPLGFAFFTTLLTLIIGLLICGAIVGLVCIILEGTNR